MTEPTGAELDAAIAEARTLHIWTDGCDYVAAETADQAREVLAEYYALLEQEPDWQDHRREWEQVPDHAYPGAAADYACDDEYNEVWTEPTAREWIEGAGCRPQVLATTTGSYGWHE